LSKTFDSGVFCKILSWFKNTLLNQVRLDVVVHEQSLICRRNSQGKRALRGCSQKIKKLQGLQGHSGRLL
jgi:hypothetical protein